MVNKSPLLATCAATLLACGSSSPLVSTDDAPVGAAVRDAGGHAPQHDASAHDAGGPSAARDGSVRVVPPPSGSGDTANADDAGLRCGDGTKDDTDGDGFTIAAGDCDDCLKTTNPSAFDVPGNGKDEDCNGSDDPSAVSCDQKLAINSTDAKDGARAIELCQFTEASSPRWGVMSARFTDATGKGMLSDPRAVGMLPSFGAVKPRAGSSVFALSSGVARAPGQADNTKGCDSFGESCGAFQACPGGTPPTGYPKASSSCSDQFGGSGKVSIFDQAAIELQIRVPINANAFSFESIFYTQEYPDFICSGYNDFFVAFDDPAPPTAIDGNILFDKNQDPIGVNTGLLAVCDPSEQAQGAQKRFACEQGDALLKGTGYGKDESTCLTSGAGAATGWLKTTAPVMPGQVLTLRFAIWDTGDSLLDSTALLDHFSWITFEGEPEKPVEIETEPVPVI